MLDFRNEHKGSDDVFNKDEYRVALMSQLVLNTNMLSYASNIISCYSSNISVELSDSYFDVLDVNGDKDLNLQELDIGQTAAELVCQCLDPESLVAAEFLAAADKNPVNSCVDDEEFRVQLAPCTS